MGFRNLQEKLEKIYIFFPEDDKSLSKMFWDVVQTHLKCCGVTGWNDWSAAKHLKNGQKVPESCCRDQENCSVYNPDSNSIYLEGCMSELELPFKIAFWAIPSLMAFVLLSALVVCSRQKNREDRHHKNRYLISVWLCNFKNGGS